MPVYSFPYSLKMSRSLICWLRPPPLLCFHILLCLLNIFQQFCVFSPYNDKVNTVRIALGLKCCTKIVSGVKLNLSGNSGVLLTIVYKEFAVCIVRLFTHLKRIWIRNKFTTVYFFLFLPWFFRAVSCFMVTSWLASGNWQLDFSVDDYPHHVTHIFPGKPHSVSILETDIKPFKLWHGYYCIPVYCWWCCSFTVTSDNRLVNNYKYLKIYKAYSFIVLANTK